MRAIQLIAHGSRRAEANQDLERVADRLRVQPEFEFVVASYLELAEPSIPSGAQLCIEAGATEIVMMPYFLSAGSHVTRDLERFRDQLSAANPSVNFVLCPPLGLHPQMIDIIKDRIVEELEQ